MLVDVSLSMRERKRLKRLTKTAMTRLLPQTPELQPVLNRGENLAIRVVSSAVGLGVAALFYFGAPPLLSLVEWPPVIANNMPSEARLVVSALLFIWLVIFSPLANWLDTNFMQFWSGAYTFRHKWSQGTTAAGVLDAAENLIRTRPDKIVQALREAADVCPGRCLPHTVMKELNGFPGGRKSPVAIVIRKFMERRLKSQYLGDALQGERRDEREFREKYFIRARAVRNAIRTQLLLNELGAELRAEIPAGSDWYRFYFTDASSQETTLFDSRDFHQRFRTAAPHYSWPVDKTGESVGETALYRVISAVENPMLQAIYGIAVAEVIEAFPEVIHDFLTTEEGAAAATEERVAAARDQYVEILQTIDVQMFGKWDKRTLRPRSDVHIQPQPILRNAGSEDDPDWIIRWDPNRIAWSVFDESDGTTRRAFAVLSEAIDRVGKRATPIILTRGDTLLIDNLRCLVARREIDARMLSRVKRAGLYPQSWWLRGYYGFRQTTARSIFYDGVPPEAPVPPPLTEKEENASLSVDTTA